MWSHMVVLGEEWEKTWNKRRHIAYDWYWCGNTFVIFILNDLFYRKSKRIITISRIESILINMVKIEVRLKSTIEMGTSFTLKLVLLAARKPLRIKLDWLTESALIILMLRMEKASFVLVIVRQQQWRIRQRRRRRRLRRRWTPQLITTWYGNWQRLDNSESWLHH